MTSSYETFTGDKNTATGKAYNWHDQRASTWYEGYSYGDTGQGSFVDLSTLTEGTADYDHALDAITNNIVGLLEQKGITAAQAQASGDYQALINQAKAGDTKGAFQGAADVVTSAHDRGDLFGADTDYTTPENERQKLAFRNTKVENKDIEDELYGFTPLGL